MNEDIESLKKIHFFYGFMIYLTSLQTESNYIQLEIEDWQ